ncbi:SDR family oxidoreductase [Candidatus Entotheonella palauensis]|uniref:SDR family oxidoreductase n=1 Tax=Candidatus Entotheonella palauensis TaxID=93172 RepID=UPI000B7ED894|nr:SDR family oxidoreductase [Candidatus Entotheonella palauensis]
MEPSLPTTASPVAIVTAASRGIGAAVARELAARGYRLVLMSRSEGSLRLADELGGVGIQGSITDAADIDALVALTIETYGRIDAVVNNSGRYSDILQHHLEKLPMLTGSRLTLEPNDVDDLLGIPDAAWHAGLDLIMLNCVRMARAVTPHMLAQGGGPIVNISGMESVQPRLIYPLGPIRLALHGFTKLYADRYGRAGIRMNCVLPGVMENASSSDLSITGAIPLRRYGGLGELAKTAAFLLSADSGYITGQMILVDGGLNRGL